MPHLAYLAFVVLHVLAAFVWLGGTLFLVVVAVPSLRHVDDPVARARVMSAVGRRFRSVGWVAIAVLLVTGVGNVIGRWGAAAIYAPAFWRSEPGSLLAAKLALVAAMLILSAVHDFVLGPQLTALSITAPGSPATVALRRKTVALSRLEVALGILVVAIAVAIVRPG